MPLTTKCLGIHQSGLILQSALRAALADLRAKPYLLDYAFAALPQDTLTADDYGQAEVDRAKQWYLSNDIKVFLTSRNNLATFPCVTIKPVSSAVAEETLGDIHYEPFEDSDIAWPNIAGPFDAIKYDYTTGNLTIPDPGIITAPGQVVVTKSGGQYTVNNTPDNVTLVIDKNIKDDFAGMVIRGQSPAFVTSLESAFFNETFMLGCHAQSEPIYAVYLHTVVVFALLVYKQSLLEKRNFERTVIQSMAEGEREQDLQQELVFSRYMQISGAVKQMWPKNISPRITAVEVVPRISGAGQVSPDKPEDASWLGDEDIDILTTT